MKKIILTLSIVLITLVTFSQKFAYVDSDYILKNIPAYEAAQAQLDQMSVDWQKEIEVLYSEIDKLYQSYQTEKVLLTEEMKSKREDEIIAKEKEAKTVQKKCFGKEGDLYKKRQELIKPIQDDIFNAVKELAEERNFAVIFDTAAGGLSMLYTDPKYDKSDEILGKLGYKN